MTIRRGFKTPLQKHQGLPDTRPGAYHPQLARPRTAVYVFGELRPGTRDHAARRLQELVYVDSRERLPDGAFTGLDRIQVHLA